ncbi:hypothetical protein HOA55_03290 [archaeon]|nr:hypothetical protein [archaeon]MBT3577403.1 hypothetical protein [archaeon]MBT6820354.1 hypothetical protein [archaeon]MBT6956095.1 hypothetical protein [archaeon]MBT7025168.1 hypothetical protein [archaeon]
MIMKIDSSIIPYDDAIRELCGTPYYGHPRGCPNCGKKDGCPPQELISDYFDFDKDMYIIFTEFPVGEFAERMRATHPDWGMMTYPDHPRRTTEFVNEVEARMRELHPEWPEEYFSKPNVGPWTSAREWYNPRRWQPTARKEHREEIERFLEQHLNLTVDRCPEARGINLTGLMHEVGIELKWQWPPVHDAENKSYIISMAGSLPEVNE